MQGANIQKIFKKKFQKLCSLHNLQPKIVLVTLGLPCNYLTTIGLARIANFFALSIDELLEIKKS